MMLMRLRRKIPEPIKKQLRPVVHALYRAKRLVQIYGPIASPSLCRLAFLVGFENFKPLLQARRLFAEEWYLKAYSVAKKKNAFSHYIEIGSKNGWKPNPYFDPEWYEEQYPDYREEANNPVLHYVSHGFMKGYSTSSFFDAKFYVERNPDVDFSRIPPLTHFFELGIKQQRAPHPHFDTLSSNDWNGKIFNLSIPVDEMLIEAPVSTVFDYAKLKGEKYKELTDLWSKEAEESRLFQSKPYVADISSALILPGTSTILVEDQSIALNDEIALYSDRFPTDTLKYLTYRRLNQKGSILFTALKNAPISVPRGILLTHEHDTNYFHWMVEIMPKAMIAEMVGIDKNVPFLVQDGLSRQLYEALAVLFPDRKVLKFKKNERVHVDHLTYISDVSRIIDLYYSPGSSQSTYLSFELLGEISQRMRRSLGKSGARKLFLGRKGGLRAILNQKQIESLVTERDFEVVDTSDFSFAEQVALFSQASVVVAPTGAAVTNILWCQPGTKVLIFASDHQYTNMTFWKSLARIAQLDIQFIYGPRAHVIEGKYAIHDDYSVPVPPLMNFLQSLECDVEGL